jgi:hypothetical protein
MTTLEIEDVFFRNKFSTGLLRCARNDVSGEGEKKEAVVVPLPTKVVIASTAKQSSANNSSPKGLQPFFKLKWMRNSSIPNQRTLRT